MFAVRAGTIATKEKVSLQSRYMFGHSAIYKIILNRGSNWSGSQHSVCRKLWPKCFIQVQFYLWFVWLFFWVMC